MSRVLVVFYSNTGTARRVADLLCSQKGWARGEITELRARVGWAGQWRCALDSWLRRRPPIRYVGPAPGRGFDAVVLIAPIWMYRLAAPMRSFVAEHARELPAVAVVSVMGGAGAPNAVAEVGSLLRRSPIFSAAFLQRDVDDGSYAPRLQALGDAVAAAPSDSPVRPVDLSPASA